MIRYGNDAGAKGDGYVSLREFRTFRSKLYTILLSMLELIVLDDAKGPGKNREIQRVTQALDRLSKELDELRAALEGLQRRDASAAEDEAELPEHHRSTHTSAALEQVWEFDENGPSRN